MIAASRMRRLNLPVSVMLAGGALAWAGIIVWSRSSVSMQSMPGSTGVNAALLFSGMWLIMMAAMMFPAVSPFVLLFRRVQASGARSLGRSVQPAFFVTGYLVVWLTAGLAAYGAYGLIRWTAARWNVSGDVLPWVAGGIVAAAGVYQLTPLKDACLKHCRSPLDFVLLHWRTGRTGAVRMGVSHGAYCLGCCWGIMAVLFVVGLMNLGLMAILSAIIILEKLAPRGVAIGRAVGIGLVALGIIMVAAPKLVPADGLNPSMNMTMTHPGTGMGHGRMKGGTGMGHGQTNGGTGMGHGRMKGRKGMGHT